MCVNLRVNSLELRLWLSREKTCGTKCKLVSCAQWDRKSRTHSKSMRVDQTRREFGAKKFSVFSMGKTKKVRGKRMGRTERDTGRESLGERNDPTRRVQERGTSDNWARSQSPKSRRHMFGKADPGPTACRRQAAHWGVTSVRGTPVTVR